MTVRRSSVIIAAALGVLAAGCGSDAAGSDSTVAVHVSDHAPSTERPKNPPPAEVLDATVVFFDADGIDARIAAPPPGPITGTAGLEAFARRHVDDDPALGSAAADALEDGKVLVGATVSSGCFAADGALLVLFDGDVRLIATGLPDPDPDIACVRAITSVALAAIDPSDLPDGATIQGA